MIFMRIVGLFVSDCVKYKLATKISHSWLHRYQRQRHTLPTHRIILHRLLMIFMIYKIRQTLAAVTVKVHVWLDRGSVFSSELLPHISVLSLVSLRVRSRYIFLSVQHVFNSLGSKFFLYVIFSP